MRKIYLFGLAGLMATTVSAQQLTIDNAQMEKISPNGEWAVGVNSVLNGAVLWNPGSADAPATTLTNFFIGKGNCVANDGTAVGYYMGGETSDAIAIINGVRTVMTMPAEAKTSNGPNGGGPTYSLSDNAKSYFASAITPDGKTIVGYWQPWEGFTFDWNSYYLTTQPFVANMDASGNVSNFIILPYPNYWNETDFFGGIPDKITAEWISEDGLTIVGMISDSKGQHNYPIVWKNVGNEWQNPIMPTVANITDEITPEPKMDMQNPLHVEAYEWGGIWYKDLESSPLLLYYITDPAQQARFWENYYNSEVPYGPFSPEEIEDYMDAEVYAQLVADYDKYINWNDPFAENGYWQSYGRWLVEMESFYENNPFFGDNAIVVNANGTVAVCYQEDAIGDLEDKNFKYTLWRIDLATGEFEKFDSKYSNLKPNQVLSNGDILATTTDQSVAYVRRLDATEFIPVMQYLKATNPDAAEYLVENLAVVEVNTDVINETTGSFYTEMITATGRVNMTNDLSVMIGGVNNEEAQAPNEGDPMPVKKQSYYLAGLGKDIVASFECTATPANGTNVPSFTSLVLTWDNQPITVDKDKLANIVVAYGNTTVGVTDANVQENEMGYELVLTIKEYADGGDVVITIPAGLVNINCWGLGYAPNEEITLNYHVASTLPAPVVNPVSGTVTSLSTITLTWDEGVSLNSSNNPAYVVTFLVNGEKQIGTSVAVKDNTITIELPETYETPGLYDVLVSAGYATDANTGDMTPAVELNYTLIGAVEATDVNPEPGVYAELPMVIVFYGEEITVNADADMPSIYPSANMEYEVGGSSIVFKFDDLADGTYTLTIPEAYVLVGNEGNWNKEAEFIYTVDATTGISIVGADNDGMFKVYNLQGVNVLNTTDASAVKALKPGIYVVNGKKIAVK